MTSKPLVGELVDYYLELDNIIAELEGVIPTEHIVRLKNNQIRLDKILTNMSKRWAKGKRERN
jgi:hypothetical protein